MVMRTEDAPPSLVLRKDLIWGLPVLKTERCIIGQKLGGM